MEGTFGEIVSVVEAVKGEAFADFRNRHGDWGLAMVLFLSRRRSGLTLPQIGEAAGGMAYKTVFAQVKRFQASEGTWAAKMMHIETYYSVCGDLR